MFVWDMDNSCDVRRVLSRCSGHELSGGRAVFTAKSRTRKVRRLGFVGTGGGGLGHDEDTEMGSSGSDGEDDFPSSTAPAKKFKFHKKISEDSDAVDHASIPRKLRSVIRKRSCHSVSLPRPNSKRTNHVNGSQKTIKDCTKKSKPDTLACYPLTRDEEEVAEAIFALAGAAPREVTTFSNKSEDSPLSSQGPSVQEGVAEVTCNPSSEESSKQNLKVDDLVKSTELSQPNLSEAIKPDMILRSFTVQANHQSLSKLNSGTKLNEFEQTGALLFPRISENTGNLGGQDEKNHTSTQSKGNGSEHLPGLYSDASCGSAGDHGSFPLQHSAAKLPFWLRPVASSSEPGPSHSQPANKSEHKAKTFNREIKSRGATHVYISRFIRSSQNSVGKEIPLLTTSHFRPSEAVTTNIHRPLNHSNSEGNGSTKTVCDSFSEKNLLDASRLTHLQEQSPLPPGNSTSRKQCYDFLSLSTGGGGVESKADHPAEPPVPRFQHLNQFNSAVSLPLPPNLLPSNLYQHHQLSASLAPLHLPPNFSQPNTYYNHPSSSPSSKLQAPISQVHLQFPPYFSSTSSMASQQGGAQPRPPQQQHPTWTAQLPPQLPAQYQLPQWQIPRQEPQPPPPPSAHFAKYLQMADHRHQMLRFPPPFPPMRASALPVSCDKGAS